MMKYVGKSGDFDVRMQAHEKQEGKCPKLREWKERWGWQNVKIYKLMVDVPSAQLNAAEIACIAQHHTQWPNGLNMTAGGEGDPEATRLSWKDPDVRAKRVAGLSAAWKDPVKRERLLDGAGERALVASKLGTTPEANKKRSATWEAKREAHLATLSPYDAALVREKMRKDREGALERKERKRQRARHHRDAVHLEALGVLADGAVSKEGQGEKKESYTSSSDACFPNKGMVRSDEAEATRGDLPDNKKRSVARLGLDGHDDQARLVDALLCARKTAQQ